MGCYFFCGRHFFEILVGEQEMNMLNSRGGVASYLKQVSVYIVP